MSWLLEIKARILALFRSGAMDRARAEEMRYHLEEATQRNLDRGMPADVARRQALLAFGGVENTREMCRDERGARLFEDLMQDLRYSLRMIGRSPAFAAIAVLTLAIGIGANTAVFSLVDRLLLRALPVRAPQELLALTKGNSNLFSYPDYKAYRDQNKVFSDLLAFSTESVNIGTGGDQQTVRGSLVSTNYFALLGVENELGRTFQPDEKDPAVVISYGMWKGWFGSSRDIIGRTLTINQSSYVIVGVARRGFTGAYVERTTDIWLPLALRPRLLPNDHSTDRKTFSWLNIWGRLKPGIGMAEAQSAMSVMFKNLLDPAYAAGYRAAAHHDLEMILVPAGRGLSPIRQDLSRPLELLMAVVALILLIASINLSSLLLTRTLSRRREIAIRRALGAPRFRLVVQLVLEGMILCAGGGVLGILLAQWLTRLLVASQPRIDLATTPLAAYPDARILLFALMISALAGLISGGSAAIHCSKTDLTTALKDDRTGLTRGGRPFRFRHGLVVIQIALSALMLVGAGLLVRNLFHLFAIDPAIDGVIIARVDMPETAGAAQNSELYLRLVKRLQSLPQVSAVSASNIVAFEAAAAARTLVPEGYSSQPDMVLAVDYNLVGPGYHELIGTPIQQGRGFTEADQAGSPPVAVINATFARLYFPGQNPIGKKLWGSSSKISDYFEIVGVSGDRKYHSLREAPRPHVDFPVLQDNRLPGTLYLRTTGKGEHLLAALQAELRFVDPRIKLIKTSTLTEMLSNSIATDRMLTILISVLGAIAFAIVVIGIYALISHSLNQRTREIGIRIALGAPARNVLALLLKEGCGVAIAGLALGLVAYLAVARFIASLLFETSPTDLPTLAAVSCLVIFLALLTSYLPGRRAGRIDPIRVLRCE